MRPVLEVAFSHVINQERGGASLLGRVLEAGQLPKRLAEGQLGLDDGEDVLRCVGILLLAAQFQGVGVSTALLDFGRYPTEQECPGVVLIPLRYRDALHSPRGHDFATFRLSRASIASSTSSLAVLFTSIAWC